MDLRSNIESKKEPNRYIHMGLPVIATILFGMLLSGCGEAATPQSHTTDFFAMDTYMSVKYTLPEALQEDRIRAWQVEDQQVDGKEDLTAEEAYSLLDTALQQEVQELEALFSVTDPQSDIAMLNRDQQVQAAAPTLELVGKALELCRATEGNLDITIYPVLKAWGFTGDAYRVPMPEEIADLLENVDHRKVRIDEDVISLPSKAEMDLGAVAKGYTGMRLKNILTEAGVTSAICSLGGNVQAIGNRPDGTPWQVAIQAPGESGILCTVAVTDQAVVTSGGYERYFEEDGKRYCHILDPANGYPAESGLLSATVIGEDGTLCDGFSTALYVMGKDDAIRFWQKRQDFDMILYTEEGEMVVTPGLKDRIHTEGKNVNEFRIIE